MDIKSISNLSNNDLNDDSSDGTQFRFLSKIIDGNKKFAIITDTFSGHRKWKINLTNALEMQFDKLRPGEWLYLIVKDKKNTGSRLHDRLAIKDSQPPPISTLNSDVSVDLD